MAAIYSFGSNGRGQLGLGHSEDISCPEKAIFPPAADLSRDPIISIKAGGNHTLALSRSGKVYGAGNIMSSESSPMKVLGPQARFSYLGFGDEDEDAERGRAGFVSATWDASVVVADRGGEGEGEGWGVKVYVLGEGAKGELGLGETVLESAKLKLIPDFPPPPMKVVDIASSMGHTVAVLSNGEVYGWGNGRKGQIGLPAEVVWRPRKIENVPFPVQRVACGREYTCFLGSPGHGELLVLGSDRSGVVSQAPAEVGGYVDVGASWGSIFVLQGDGKITAWGRDDHGQLPPKDLPKIAQIGVGSEHVLAKTVEGAIVAWGWGEHGNCGDTLDGQGDVKGRWNDISCLGIETSKAVALASGCATSWIMVSNED